MNRRGLDKVFCAALSPLGFVKVRSNWYLDRRTGVVGVVGLQRSRWSPCYYLNVGFQVRRINPGKHLQAWECCAHGRVSRLLRRTRAFEGCLDLESPMDDAQRHRVIERFLSKRLGPFVVGLSTPAAMQRAYPRGALERAGTTPRYRRWLRGRGVRGLPREDSDRSGIELLTGKSAAGRAFYREIRAALRSG